jgi:fido (protein-threonine AMPylation protein)
MIDATDFTIPGTGVLRNKLGITDPAALSRAATDSTALRLAELQASPVRGGFDSAHLQAIHHHIYQDLYDWAGELRRSTPAMCPRLKWRNPSTASSTA